MRLLFSIARNSREGFVVEFASLVLSTSPLAPEGWLVHVLATIDRNLFEDFAFFTYYPLAIVIDYE